MTCVESSHRRMCAVWGRCAQLSCLISSHLSLYTLTRHTSRSPPHTKRRHVQAERVCRDGTCSTPRPARCPLLGDDEGDHAAHRASRGQEPTPSGSPPASSLWRNAVRGWVPATSLRGAPGSRGGREPASAADRTTKRAARPTGGELKTAEQQRRRRWRRARARGFDLARDAVQLDESAVELRLAVGGLEQPPTDAIGGSLRARRRWRGRHSAWREWRVQAEPRRAAEVARVHG